MKPLHPTLKGIIASFPPWIIISLLYLFSSYSFQYTMSLAALIGIFCVVGGAMLGYIAGRVKAWRRLKLIAGVTIIYWFCAVTVAVALMLLSDDMDLSEKITGSLWLGSAGALIFGIFACPIIIIAALLLEFWTRGQQK